MILSCRSGQRCFLVWLLILMPGAVAERVVGQDLTVRGFVAPSYNRMGAWAEGFDVLRSRARALDRRVGVSLDPGLGISLGAGALWEHGSGLGWGVEVEWLHDRLEIELPHPAMPSFRSYYQATASSRLIRLVAQRAPLPGEPIALEGSAGVGRGALHWASSQGRAVGAGWGPYVGVAGTMERQRRGLHVAMALGVRWHPVFLSYTDAAVPPPGEHCLQYPDDVACPARLFEDTADLETFLEGRHADFSGLYLSFQVAWSR